MEEYPRRFSTIVLICLAATLSGAFIGGLTNTINGLISRDYFAITMDWDWAVAMMLAVLHGMSEGAAIGLFFGVLLSISAAASTQKRCPPEIAMNALQKAVTIVLLLWTIGGTIGFLLALAYPKLWGYFFIGVPLRVNLPRFAWVGGSIAGAYLGTVIALPLAAIQIHTRYKQLRGGTKGFAVIPRAVVDH